MWKPFAALARTHLPPSSEERSTKQQERKSSISLDPPGASLSGSHCQVQHTVQFGSSVAEQRTKAFCFVGLIAGSRIERSRTGAVFRRSSLAVAPRFLWECLNSQTMSPFPAPATSHPACRFPALGWGEPLG